MIPSLKVSKKTAVIEFPGNENFAKGSVKVTVTKPSRTAKEKYGMDMAAYDEWKPIMDHSRTPPRPFQDRTGAAIMGRVPGNVPPHLSVEFLAGFVENVEGFEEPFTRERAAEYVAALGEEDFDYDDEVERELLDVEGNPVMGEDGKPKTKKEKVRMAFLWHILRKIQDRETWRSPLETTSSSTSTDSSATEPISAATALQ